MPFIHVDGKSIPITKHEEAFGINQETKAAVAAAKKEAVAKLNEVAVPATEDKLLGAIDFLNRWAK